MAMVWVPVIFIASTCAGFAAAEAGLIPEKLRSGELDLHSIQLALEPVAIVLTLLVASRLRVNPLTVLALRRPVRVLRLVAVAFAVWVLILVVTGVIGAFGPENFLDAPNQEHIERSTRMSALLTSLLSGGLLVPIGEELLFRGLLLVSFFNTRLWFWSGAVISSLLFAVAHNPTSVNLLLHAPYFVLGLCFVAALKYTGSLLIPIVLHMLKNTLAILVIAL